MTSLNISLPEQLKAYVELQVAKGEFGTPSEFIRDLIRQDKKRRRGKLEAELLEALDSPQMPLDLDSVDERSLLGALRQRLVSRASK